MIIHLSPILRPANGALPRACDRYPGWAAGAFTPTAGQAARHPCLALHRMGFLVPRRLPAGRWALTPPFHPYPKRPNTKRAPGGLSFCDTFHRRPACAGRPPRVFRGMLPCGVRTFLSSRSQSDHLPNGECTSLARKPKIFSRVGLYSAHLCSGAKRKPACSTARKERSPFQPSATLSEGERDTPAARTPPPKTA